MTKPQTLGEYIRTKRLDRGWTQEQLAVQMGLGLSGQVTVSEIERDQRRPRVESLGRFAAALELDCREIARLVARAYELEVLQRLRSSQ